MIVIVYNFTQSGSSSGLFNRLHATQEMKRQILKKYTEPPMLADTSNSTYKTLLRRKLNNSKFDSGQYNAVSGYRAQVTANAINTQGGC